MTEYDLKIRDIFLNKPECIIDFPDWMLSKDQINILRNIEGLAMVEMAGRDSVAAAIKSVEEEGFTDLLPTYVYTGTEYGNWESVTAAVERLRQNLSDRIMVHDLVVFGSPIFWQGLNGRFISYILKKFKFYTPCIGCHLYLHSARIPLAVMLGNIPVITGEREIHDGREKINQVSEALDAYKKIGERFNIQLLMPLRNIHEGKEIEQIIGIDWKQGGDQLECVLSRNYRDSAGNNIIKKKDTFNLLYNFLVPCTEKIIRGYLEGSVPNHMEIALEIMDISL